MITFLAPWWGLILAPLLGLGLLALFLGRRRPVPVPSVRLWRDLTAEASDARPARRVDPAWALIFLAAVLIALAVTQPRWQSRAPAWWADLAVSVRATPDSCQAFLQLRDGELPATLALSVADQTQSVTPERLGQGLLLDVPPRENLTVQLQTPDQRPIATYHLTRPATPTFGLLTQGRVSPALQRVLAIQPGLRPVETADTRVLLLGPDATVPASSDAPFTLLISESGPAPGLTLGALSIPAASLPLHKASPDPVLAAVNPRAGVLRFRRATLDASWKVLLQVGDAPFAALRRQDGSTVLWLAAPMTAASTDWPTDPSFVIFFTSLLQHTLASSNAHPESDWVLTSPFPSAAPTPPPLASLTFPLILSALAATLFALTLFLRRT